MNYWKRRLIQISREKIRPDETQDVLKIGEGIIEKFKENLSKEDLKKLEEVKE